MSEDKLERFRVENQRLREENQRIIERIKELEGLLADALPKIECENQDDSLLITTIGQALNTND